MNGMSLEEQLRRLAWDLFDWSADPPLSLDAAEQRTIARQLLEAADTISTLRAERDERDINAMVAEFHRAGGYPVRRGPAVPSDDEVRFRLRLIAEEFFEQFDACFQGALQKQLVAEAKDRVRQLIDIGPVGTVDLPTLVDAWEDLKYVIAGSEVTFGVDGNAAFRVVHAANMAKFGPHARRDANGKTMKPPGWKPPDIAGELERQRREGDPTK